MIIVQYSFAPRPYIMYISLNSKKLYKKYKEMKLFVYNFYNFV